METAKITSKGQMTIPKRIRERAGLHSGDVVVLDIEGGEVVMRKLAPRPETEDEAYLSSVEATLNEWLSPEDEDAWKDL